MLKLSANDTKKTRQASTSFSGDNVKIVKSCDAAVQTVTRLECATTVSSASVLCGECGVPELARNLDHLETDSDVLLKSVYKEGIHGSLPQVLKDLGKEDRTLARRVIVYTNSDRIVADEIVQLMPGFNNVKV